MVEIGCEYLYCADRTRTQLQNEWRYLEVHLQVRCGKYRSEPLFFTIPFNYKVNIFFKEICLGDF